MFSDLCRSEKHNNNCYSKCVVLIVKANVLFVLHYEKWKRDVLQVYDYNQHFKANHSSTIKYLLFYHRFNSDLLYVMFSNLLDLLFI